MKKKLAIITGGRPDIADEATSCSASNRMITDLPDADFNSVDVDVQNSAAKVSDVKAYISSNLGQRYIEYKTVPDPLVQKYIELDHEPLHPRTVQLEIVGGVEQLNKFYISSGSNFEMDDITKKRLYFSTENTSGVDNEKHVIDDPIEEGKLVKISYVTKQI